MQRIILHADLDSFFVACERVRDPSLRGRPVVVGGSPERRGVVASASYEAREYGIHSAMPMGQALRLCRDLVVVHPTPGLYGRASRAVMSVLDSYSPVVERASVDEAYVDLTGTTRLLGSAMDLAVRMRGEIEHRFGLETTLGVATNRLVSKVAAGLAKPSGLLDVLPGQEAGLLAPLKVQRLPGVGPKTRKRLNTLGVARVGELAAVPPTCLEAAFGLCGLVLHSRARGQDDTPLSTQRQALSIGTSETFSVDTADRVGLEAVLLAQIERTAREMRKQGIQARTITVSVRYADFVNATRSRTIDPPSDIDMELFDEARELMRRALSRRTLVRLLGVRFSGFDHTGWQMGLFDARGRARGRDLVLAMDRVRERYGESSVQWGRTRSIPAATA
ncbi:MAG: DNA polymerase IV [Deltaproteobacteria bacterium]|nr:DNA polymerase IV [Deltaproteobacteria bacterium]